jgi:hypothetical protein
MTGCAVTNRNQVLTLRLKAKSSIKGRHTENSAEGNLKFTGYNLQNLFREVTQLLLNVFKNTQEPSFRIRVRSNNFLDF